MDQPVIWSDYGFEGKLVKVRIDTVEIEGVGKRQREVVEHPGAVAVLPVLSDGRVVLVRQYRPAVGRALLEVPAGTLESGESVEECARRELAEETGYTTRRLTHLIRFFVSPGWCNEELIVYLAEDISPGEQSQEDDEQIEVELVTREQVLGLIASGDIGDAKTMVSLMAYFGLTIPKER